MVLITRLYGYKQELLARPGWFNQAMYSTIPPSVCYYCTLWKSIPHDSLSILLPRTVDTGGSLYEVPALSISHCFYHKREATRTYNVSKSYLGWRFTFRASWWVFCSSWKQNKLYFVRVGSVLKRNQADSFGNQRRILGGGRVACNCENMSWWCWKFF